LHWLVAGQLTGVPVHTPAMQWSLVRHGSLAVHMVLFGAVGFEHVPVEGLHVPATWHWSLAVHVMGSEPTHVPFMHLSICVHGLPSSHIVPLVALPVCSHVCVPVMHDV
jgi:hypothetical protein